jgi:hypothetical protein
VEQAVLAKIMKRRIEAEADQQYRNALRQRLEEGRVAQDRERQFIELFRRLDPAGRDLAISVVEGIASQQETQRKPAQWGEGDGTQRRSQFWEDDPI